MFWHVVLPAQAFLRKKNETQKEKKEKVETLDEVVVTATKFKLKKENIGKSYLQITQKEH